MSEQQPKFHPYFHKFMIYFALWMFAAFAVLFGIKHILDGIENGYHGFELFLLIAVNALLIVLGLFTVKVRFDLAAFRGIAVKELLIAAVAGAVLCLANNWVRDYMGDDTNMSFVTAAIFLVAWGYAVHRYYKDRPYLFTE